MKVSICFADCVFAVTWLDKHQDGWRTDEKTDENEMTWLLFINSVVISLDSHVRRTLLSYVRVCRKRREDEIESALREQLTLLPKTYKRLVSHLLLARKNLHEEITMDELLDSMIDRHN